MTAPTLPGHLGANLRLSRWLDFGEDGVVVVRTGKVEIGQGILTALAQIVAEELDVGIERIRLRPASTADGPNEGATTGSYSVQHSGGALRLVAAETRARFLAAAAELLDAPRSDLAVKDGVIEAPGGGKLSYWQLSNRVSLDVDATGRAIPKSPSSHRVVGRPLPRLDLPDKIFGRPRYIHDIELPGLLHGRILRPPSLAARLEMLDEAKARALPGIVRIVRDGDFVGVLAEREDIAVKAVARLRAAATWREADALPPSEQLHDWLRSAASETTSVVAPGGGPGEKATKTLRASYTKPYVAHASIGPSCALAHWQGDSLKIWSHSQSIFGLQADLALALGIKAEATTVEHAEGSGCYGHNGADDVALDAALLARQAPGRPVRVLWSREDEMTWSPVGPAMRVEIEAGLDAAGEVRSWRHAVWSNGHSSRPGRAPTPMLLAGFHLAKPFPRLSPINVPLSSGGGAERNAKPPYRLASLEVVSHRVVDAPIRTSALRTLGAYANVFAIESMVDEIARAKDEDGLSWRLRHLEDPRARAVVEDVATRAGWSTPKSAPHRGRGIAYARYKEVGAYCAVVAEIEAGDTLRVVGLWLSVDVGQVVNPDGVANQIEGGAIQSTSWTLKEQVAFDRRRITSATWSEYQILGFPETPSVFVNILSRPDEPLLGAGEAAQGPTAAAIANAVDDALGIRIRDLPITRERIMTAS